MKRSSGRVLAAILVFSAVSLSAYLRTASGMPEAPNLSGFAPPGALLALQCPDLHALLTAWTQSPEEARWLASDNFAAFSRSRLFGRLKEAQDEFATSAGLPPDMRFLTGVAGRESFFAWYDIGKLEFLYITRLPTGEAEKTPLLALRDRFQARAAGGTTFYVRSEGEPARTVAFAVHGDTLLLATREDLMADALQLMAQPATNTLEHEPWYAAAQAAAHGPPGDLHMTLNLNAITRSPYFRSYWVQGNVTEMRGYSAAVSDLYRSAGELREERVLLPASSPNGAVRPSAQDLAPVLHWLPAGTVYRALSQPGTDVVLSQLQDKLLWRVPGGYTDPHGSPSADLQVPVAGTSTDLEQRIDEPLVVSAPSDAAVVAVRSQIDAARPVSMLVFSRPEPAPSGDNSSPNSVFLPMGTGVVLQASGTWDAGAMQAALSTATAARVSVPGVAMPWETAGEAGNSWVRMKGPVHLALAVRGQVFLLASDDETMRLMLAQAPGLSSKPSVAEVQAGVDFAAVRGPLSLLAKRLDHTAAQPVNGEAMPPFFAGNLVSLGETFRDLASETFTQAPVSASNANVRQTVVYRWARGTGSTSSGR